jgi:hypothetical protein
MNKRGEIVDEQERRDKRGDETNIRQEMRCRNEQPRK